ncbi:hypothetical protein GBAR_LOCUS22505 [Geodia barretti]|uniref:Uncharacterized protein n=1 Tax=Geodia barretti TaxID=519541 RepID=A0AA35T353_GEOBA|nr:hypothetical protein GBAR_LOCUS22505 [Geodia barretti]
MYQVRARGSPLQDRYRPERPRRFHGEVPGSIMPEKSTNRRPRSRKKLRIEVKDGFDGVDGTAAQQTAVAQAEQADEKQRLASGSDGVDGMPANTPGGDVAPREKLLISDLAGKDIGNFAPRRPRSG